MVQRHKQCVACLWGNVTDDSIRSRQCRCRARGRGDRIDSLWPLGPGGQRGSRQQRQPQRGLHACALRCCSWPHIVALDALNEKAGWVLTDRGLLATNDGGESWRTLPLTSVAGAHSLVVRDETHLAIGRIDGLDVFVDASDDGGQTWNETRLPARSQPGDVHLAASTTLLAVLVQQTTSANFSQADRVCQPRRRCLSEALGARRRSAGRNWHR